MSVVKELGMKKNWIYEVIISSFHNTIPHAAPFGVKTEDFNLLVMEFYKGSNTLENILSNKEFAINMVADPAIFYHALYDKKKLNFGASKMIKAPIITDAIVTLESRMTDTEDMGHFQIIHAEVVHSRIRNGSGLTNRAESLVLESLILATRIPHFPERNILELIDENYRVIKKVAPGSKYEHIMKELMEKCSV